jgi:hypothetical protein
VTARPGCYTGCMKKQRQQVILYGDTLILAGVQAILSASPNLEVIVLDPALDNPADRLRDLHPAAVIFDLESLADLPLAFLQQAGMWDQPEQPEQPLLIGVNPSRNEMLVLSGQSKQALRAADLMDVIRQKESNTETVKGGNHEKNYRR